LESGTILRGTKPTREKVLDHYSNLRADVRGDRLRATRVDHPSLAGIADGFLSSVGRPAQRAAKNLSLVELNGIEPSRLAPLG
jgi:hypothetical protein